MANELMTRWIGALRSDEYNQGTGNLKDFNAGPDEKPDFCCLGVLCDLVDSALWDDTQAADRGYSTFEGKSDYPPKSVLELVGISYEEAQRLASFNDEDGYRFADIANYLETGRELCDHEECETDEDGNYSCGH